MSVEPTRERARRCPDCGAPVPPGSRTCLHCGRFVPGADAPPLESRLGRGLLLILWMWFWPVSMLLGTPREATQEVPPFRLLRAFGLAVVIAGALVLLTLIRR